MENQTTNNSIILNLNRIETMKNNNKSRMLNKASHLVGLFLVLGIMMGLSSQDVFAQVPPANTTIGNQASATYTDGGGNERSVTSNTVETVVSQVYAVDISDGLTKTVSDGGQVQYPHVITNNGNGPDSFTISAVDAVGDVFNFDDIAIYPDADLDGVPDNFTEISATPPIGAGERFGIVIVVTVPATFDDADNALLDVTATSVGDGGQSDTAQDEAIIRDGAVIDVQKSFSKSTAAAGETITVTFRFSNNGNAAATNLDIRDPLPDSLIYQAGTALWSGSSTNLGDLTGNGDDPTGITYEFDDTGTQDSVLAVIGNLGAGQSGTITFDVEIGNVSGTTLSNTAQFKYDSEDFVNTNTATVTVGDSYGVVIDASVVDNAPDTVVSAAVSQGEQIDFVNAFVNTGTTTDVFNITTSEVSGSEYPTGTTFVLLKSDGSGGALNPFTDTNNDGIPDTGPIAAGDTVQVILQVNLPASADATGPFVIAKTVTSINDPTKSATLYDKLDDITANSVDLTNDAEASDAINALGIGAGPEATAVDTVATDPNNTITFSLFVENTSTSNSDAYDIFATGASINNPALPSDWTVTFKDPNNGNSVITNTGTIAAGGNKEITVEIIIPAGQSPGDFDAVFKVESPTSGATDTIYDLVTVNVDRNISLVANQNGQIFPGGSKEYAHTLRIDSNVDENDATETDPSDFEMTVSNSEADGFTAIIYWDKDNSGDISTGDSVITTAGGGATSFPVTIGSLTFGDEVNFVLKVTAGTGVQDGTTNTTTITITDANGEVSSVANADITKVVAGLLVLEKSQATDTTGFLQGTGVDPFSIDPLQAAPGDSVYYKIVITNNGAATVDDVVIIDTTPAYTVIRGSVVVFGDIDPGGADPAVEEPTDGSAGTIKVLANDLAPYESFTVIFKVKLNE